MIYAITVGIVGDHHIAEDVAQETFIDAFLQLARLSEPSKFGAWLSGIARRKALHWVSRRKAWLNLDELTYVPAAFDASPEAYCITRERDESVRRALLGLSDKNRAVAVMFYISGLPVAVIAQKLNLPEGTIKSRLYEARKKLKGALDYMDEAKQPLSPNFERIVREKIEELKKYYLIGAEFEKIYKEAERLINQLPESDVKKLAISEINIEKALRAISDDEIYKQIKGFLNAGIDIEELGDHIISIMHRYDYKNRIILFDRELLPLLHLLGSRKGNGHLLFWRGAANMRLKNPDEARADFLRSADLTEKSDIFHALALSALKSLDLLSQNAANVFDGFIAISESYIKEGGKLIFRTQPGMGMEDPLISLHRFSPVMYFISRFDSTKLLCGVYFDTDMEVGKTYQSESGDSMTLLGYGETVCVYAGRFENCMHLRYTASNYNAEVWYAEGVGLVKVIFTGTVVPIREEYELSEYEIKGGDGFFPFCEGNRWRYVKLDVPDFIFQRIEYVISWTDGVTANLIVTNLFFCKKENIDFMADSDYYISECERLCDNWQINDAIEELKKAVRANTTQNAALFALAGIRYLSRISDYHKKIIPLPPVIV